MGNTIVIENIKKNYKTKKTSTLALNDVSLTFKQGEFVAICGQSGSGKTTLLNIIAGLERNYEGKCIVNGEDLSELTINKISKKRCREIGIIFQFFNLIESLTVEENITISSELNNKKIKQEELNNVLDELNLNDKKKNLVNELSGGEKQRVAIARVLLNDSDIILADEPTGNLDSENAKNVMEILSILSRKRNKTIIMVTHNLELLSYMDRVLHLKDGRIISDEYV